MFRLKINDLPYSPSPIAQFALGYFIQKNCRDNLIWGRLGIICHHTKAKNKTKQKQQQQTATLNFHCMQMNSTNWVSHCVFAVSLWTEVLLACFIQNIYLSLCFVCLQQNFLGERSPHFVDFFSGRSGWWVNYMSKSDVVEYFVSGYFVCLPSTL